jgi:lipopolysaccharide transport system ATP-binding protein
MSQTAIQVERLGKLYRIPQVRGPRAGWLANMLQWRRGLQETWALRDVSLSVSAGEVIGIVGRNGAGKSTLLKVLSRITEPTEGRAEIRGRLASLLEIGTGFHNELTGRENIALAGAILGMRRDEIRRYFDAIVDFAEIGAYLDTPVKHYSSGMYVRLAFAVAAHLSSEIVVVDEVLAVGDIEFQKRCLRRMGSISQDEGRTVLFVSHSLASVRALCSKTLWIDRGRVERIGPSDEVLEAYARSMCIVASDGNLNLSDRDGSGEIRFTRGGIVSDDGRYLSVADWGRPCRVRVEFETSRPVRNPNFTCGIDNVFRARVATAGADPASAALVERMAENGAVEFEFDPLYLAPGEYVVTLGCATPDGRYLDRVIDAFWFQVHRDGDHGAIMAHNYLDGDCQLPARVRVETGELCAV